MSTALLRVGETDRSWDCLGLGYQMQRVVREKGGGGVPGHRCGTNLETRLPSVSLLSLSLAETFYCGNGCRTRPITDVSRIHFVTDADTKPGWAG